MRLQALRGVELFSSSQHQAGQGALRVFISLFRRDRDTQRHDTTFGIRRSISLGQQHRSQAGTPIGTFNHAIVRATGTIHHE